MSKEVVKKYPAGEPWGPMAEYVVVRIPDKMLLASLINKARGNRTMAQLADACNVSASTLSRAVNGKITKPMSLDLIQRIAENAEAKNAALFERLARANGYATKDEYEGIGEYFTIDDDENDDKKSSHKNILGQGIKMRNVVMTELLKRGIPVKLLTNNAAKIDSEFSIGINYAFSLEIDLGSGSIIWSFFLHDIKFGDHEFDIYEAGVGFTFLKGEMLRNIGQWFLIDSWESEKLKDRLHTILVLDDRNLCESLTEILTNKKVNNDFSFVSVDIDEECVNFEAYMERKDGQEHELIFDRPVIDSENYSETWPKHKNQGGK